MDEPQQIRSRTFTWEDPSELVNIGKTLGGLEYLRAIQSGELPSPPFARLLGVDLAEVSEGKAVFSMKPAEYHYNPLGSVHGGVTAALLDSAMGCAVHTLLQAGQWYTTVEIKINYLRPLSANTGIVYSTGQIIHMGNKIATAEGRVTDEAGKLYAHGTTSCILLRP
jgi:uncharacterized protein (TIGR00369 family)